jgi:transcriptional regulator of arginine metabolism
MKQPSPLQRREAILEILRGRDVSSQEELQGLLARRGFRVAQPTLSRDIRELGLAKTPAGWVVPQDLAGSSTVVDFVPQQRRDERLDHFVREFVVSVERGGTLVVVRTPPADAQPVARALDEASLPDVLGTIGGDDTIFVATRNEAAARALVRRLSTHLTTSRTRRTRA